MLLCLSLYILSLNNEKNLQLLFTDKYISIVYLVYKVTSISLFMGTHTIRATFV